MFNIFLPSIINDFYIFDNNTAFVYIVGTHIYCFLISMNGNKRIIKKYLYKKISFDEDNNDFLSIYSKAISELIISWSFNNLKLVISGTNAFSKVLKFPFNDIEKIKMILPFEIEQYLPFVLSDCIVDGVPAQLENKKNGISVLGIALKQEIIDIFKSVFKNINITMNSMTLDIAEIVAFHAYSQIIVPHILIFKSIESISLLFYNKDKELYDIRVLHLAHDTENSDSSDIIAEYLFSIKETENQSKTEGTDEENQDQEKKDDKEKEKTIVDKEQVSSLSQNEIEESIIDIIEKNNNENKINNNVTKNKIGIDKDELSSTIFITLKSFNILPENVIIYIIDPNNNLKDLETISHATNMNVVDYKEAIENIIKQKKYNVINNIAKEHDEHKNLTDSPINSLITITTLNVFLINSFNLNSEEHVKARNNILFKQIVAGFLLGFLIIMIALVLNIIRLNSLNQEKIRADKESLMFLKKEFSLSAKFLSSLEVALKEVNAQVDKMHNDLPIIATEKKDKFLLTLTAISDHVSKDIKDLVIQRIIWNNGSGAKKDTLTISGNVGSFSSLSLLEEGLRKTELFVSVPKIQDLHFNFNLTLITT